MPDPWGIDIAACRRRQQRLTVWMQEHSLDRVLLTQRENIQWVTGVYYSALFAPVAMLTVHGQCLLVAPQRAPEAAAVDEVLTYPAKQHSTLCNDQKQRATEVLLQSSWISGGLAIGTEFSAFPRFLQEGPTVSWHDVESVLYRLRRRKEPDELAKICRAIAATEKMYAAARDCISPGISELEVFNRLQSVAVQELGEPLTGTGNDYQCGSRGGPPRSDHTAKAGELYILDLGPAFRGYYADNCRTLAVTRATDLQHTAWKFVTSVFDHVETTVRPGKSAQQLFHEAQSILDRAPVGTFNHHLGHGIGLYPHEAPHLNPHWNDFFEENDVFAVEPGLYAPELQVGLRIENNYRVTATGVERLSNFGMEMA